MLQAVRLLAFADRIFQTLMTGNSSQTRKPYDAAPYASLRQTEAAAALAKGDIAGAAHEAAGEFAQEDDKLSQLRSALWSAFVAGPDAGLPNTLIDLTMAYTNALRLQLNLKALTARRQAPRPAGPTARPDPNTKS